MTPTDTALARPDADVTATTRPAQPAGRPLEEAAAAVDQAREYTRAVLATAEAEASLNAANVSATISGSIVAGVLAVHAWLFALMLLAWWVVHLGVPVPVVAGAALLLNLLALWVVSRQLRSRAAQLGFPRTRSLLGLASHA